MEATDPNVPFIEQPDMMDKPQESGLYCFLDQARPCSGECMSYLSTQPEGADYENQQWAKCMLLVNIHKGGKHLVALAQQGGELLKHLRVARADAKRGI